MYPKIENATVKIMDKRTKRVLYHGTFSVTIQNKSFGVEYGYCMIGGFKFYVARRGTRGTFKERA